MGHEFISGNSSSRWWLDQEKPGIPLSSRAVTYNTGPFFKVPLAYCSGFALLISLLVLSVGSVHAEWVSVGGKLEEGLTGYTVYVEPDTIRRNGEVVKLWALMDFSAMQTEPNPTYLSVQSQREFDCTEERVRLLALTAFSGNMGSGKVVFSYSDPNDQGISIEQGSVAQSLWKFVCSM
jgi:hypothetical protein